MTFIEVLRSLRASRIGPYINIPRRFYNNSAYAIRPAAQVLKWLFNSREDTNLTYALTERNLRYLVHFLAIATASPVDAVKAYIDEVVSDRELHAHIVGLTASGPYRSYADLRCDFGRRIGWYALARILKPDVVVETGIDKGFGAVVLCAALLRNGKGRYYGTDINPRAGYFLKGKYAQVGTVLYSDSIESLTALDGKVDLFVNDSDHSGEYELREYETIAGKLSPNAVVIGDNAHATSSLVIWSEAKNRSFMFWREQPQDHWYPGGGIGLSLPNAHS